MHQGVRLANVVSHNAQFSAAFEEQQAICGMFDHRQSNPYIAALAWYFAEPVMQRRLYRSAIVSKSGNPIYG
jgi:hypothetical protein